MKTTNLIKFAAVVPATLIIAGGALACPFARNRSQTVHLIRNGETTVLHVQSLPSYRLTPASYTSETRPYGFIGVAIEQLNPSRAQQLNQSRSFSRRIPETEGILVVRTLEQGPAAAAGLVPGDVLLGVNGEMISRVEQVQALIGRSPVGDLIPVTFRRGNDIKTVNVQAGNGQILRPLMLQQQ